MKLSKITTFLIVMFMGLILIGPINVKAANCFKSDIENFEKYKDCRDTSNDVSCDTFHTSLENHGSMYAAATCTCNDDETTWNKSASLSNRCDTMKRDISSSTKFFSPTHIGAKYTLSSADLRDTARYNYGMQSLWGLVKAILNLFIGILLFVLGFGFLWNLSQLGIRSSNPQARRETISKIGDIFATAIFVGCIPIVYNLIAELIKGLSQ